MTGEGGQLLVLIFGIAGGWAALRWVYRNILKRSDEAFLWFVVPILVCLIGPFLFAFFFR